MLERIRAETDTILGSSTVSDVALDRWETAAETHGYAFKIRPPREVLEDVLVDFAELQVHASRRQPLDSQQRVSRISAQLAGTAANILTDLGHHREAGSWFTTALIAASETRDRALTCWVQAREATVSLYHQKPPQTAITIAVEAQARAGESACAGAALAAATEARAWARLGHAENAIAALRRADSIAAKLRGADLANSIFGYPQQQLAFHREATLTLVGDVDEAVEAQNEALALYPPGEHVNPTLIRLDQAACTIRLGDHGSGHQKALQHLGRTPTRYRTALVVSRARELADLAGTDGRRPDDRARRSYLEAVDALVLAA
jgi:tetratricopeptide (TPR) repeat protein